MQRLENKTHICLCDINRIGSFKKRRFQRYISFQNRFFQEEPIQHDFSGVTEFVLKGHGFLGTLLSLNCTR